VSGRAVVTIGVYGWTLETFLEALRDAGVRVLLDVRQRRGVRGREYAWANARRLEEAVDAAGIEYRHEAGLAPTTELRKLQYREDEREGVGKRSRARLSPAFAERYAREILDAADLAALAEGLPAEGAAALLCVERDAEACHRSLVADRLAERFGAAVRHLLPPSG
jgi:uncharacterized protein (DUF488 family)